MSLEFIPTRVFYEPGALDYPLGKTLVERFKYMGITMSPTTSHNRITGIPGNTAAAQYREAKRTLVIGVRRSKTFQSCKPSAHYQLPLVTSCPGMCEYCYLATTLGKKPYVRIYVNLDEILGIASNLIKERLPEMTQFEGAATSDPIPVERYTGALKQTIEFFGREPNGRFHPLGFIIAPIFRFEGWQEAYRQLMERSAEELVKRAPSGWSSEQLTLEFISHRFTSKAKATILEVFPNSSLPMVEDERKFKYGQFGYGKYIYQPEEMQEMKEFFQDQAKRYFPLAQVEYFI
ncbi:MAG TPA: spore photoproduct lyase [Desulfosporosinus sp.]|nr:spore photoproduct lyase [Desulfosporosinus sp.]